jgi:hypothetical protein
MRTSNEKLLCVEQSEESKCIYFCFLYYQSVFNFGQKKFYKISQVYTWMHILL